LSAVLVSRQATTVCLPGASPLRVLRTVGPLSHQRGDSRPGSAACCVLCHLCATLNCGLLTGVMAITMHGWSVANVEAGVWPSHSADGHFASRLAGILAGGMVVGAAVFVSPHSLSSSLVLLRRPRLLPLALTPSTRLCGFACPEALLNFLCAQPQVGELVAELSAGRCSERSAPIQ